MRIIAGSARGRRFDAPDGMDTRPTLDRVKEALFGVLQFRIPDSVVLDLFSGSGSLGLEAASRGARRVVCNDHARACADQIRKSAASLRLDATVETLCMDYAACLRAMQARGERFDFVFIDAPYRDGTAELAASQAFMLDLIAKDGMCIIEHAAGFPPQVDPALARRSETRTYGHCALSMYERR